MLRDSLGPPTPLGRLRWCSLARLAAVASLGAAGALGTLLLAGCASPPRPGGPLLAGAPSGSATAPARAWSEAMEQRRARLADASSSAGVEVLRTPDNALLLRWSADRAFAGSNALSADAAAPVWDRVAAELAGGPPWRARVQGHSDASTADNEAAAALAAQRALSLRDALVQRGLPSDAIDVEAWAARAPLLANDTPEGRARNRRVEIWLTD